jgi:hypothetical protein
VHSFPFHGFNRRELPVEVWLEAKTTWMQFTIMPGCGTAPRTGNWEQLSWCQLFHSHLNMLR